MVNMKNLKAGKVQQVDDAYDVGIGTQFSAETNKRDEDEEMMKSVNWMHSNYFVIMLLKGNDCLFFQIYWRAAEQTKE